MAFSSGELASSPIFLLSTLPFFEPSTITSAKVAASDWSELLAIITVRAMVTLVCVYQSLTMRSLASGSAIMRLVASAFSRAFTSAKEMAMMESSRMAANPRASRTPIRMLERRSIVVFRYMDGCGPVCGAAGEAYKYIAENDFMFPYGKKILTSGNKRRGKNGVDGVHADEKKASRGKLFFYCAFVVG